MSTSVLTANSIQDLIYKGLAWADIAENDSSAPATNIQVGLHTAAPVTSLGISNEVTVGQWDTYAPVNVARGVGWDSAVNGATKNAALIQFAEMLAGTGCTITHVSTRKNGTIIHYGALAATRNVSAGIQPQFAGNALISTQT
jgi:hypothetical protein